MDIQFILTKISDVVTSFPYYGEIISLIGGFFIKVFYDFYEDWKGGKKDEKEYDKRLFIEIRDKLLTTQMMIFFRDFNAQESLSREFIYPLLGFIDTKSRDPNLVFLNKKIETNKVRLFQDINDIMYTLSIETYGVENNLEYQSVPRAWRLEDPKRYEEVTKLLQNKAEKTWKSYEKFLENGKFKFKV